MATLRGATIPTFSDKWQHCSIPILCDSTTATLWQQEKFLQQPRQHCRTLQWQHGEYLTSTHKNHLEIAFTTYIHLCVHSITGFLLHQSTANVTDSRRSSVLVKSGVPYGYFLPPTLYLLFINDLSQNICQIFSLMLTDDSTLHFLTTLFARIK